MTRRYENGEVVGEVDPPIDFERWLCSEIEQARRICDKVDARASLMDWLCPYARQTTLLETLAAYEDSRRAA